MSASFPTLPTGPFEHVAMDYVRLRAEGIRLLGRLSGQQWTDFNAHDPGITILEQLCYAITDLAYRINHPIQDLFAGSIQALPEPAEILSCSPVTLTDLRKLAFDDTGVENAWVDDEVEPELIFHYQEVTSDTGQLRFGAGDGEFDAGPVSLRGLHRVLLQSNATATTQAVIERLHQNRGLGEDFDFATLEPFHVKIDAEVEIGAGADPETVRAAIKAQIDEYLTPPLRFMTPTEAQAAGRSFEQIYDGPRLTRGVVGAPPERREAVYSSDLIHVIMDAPQVRAVRSLELQGQSAWMLEVPAGKCARRDPGSVINLNVGEAPLQTTAVQDAGQSASTVLASPTPGRDRGLAEYQSIHELLPPTYGVGPLGLPASAPARRVAQVRQLEAYLLIFDQLLANAFAQLAHAHELLTPALEDAPTYFSQPVASESLQELISGTVSLPEPVSGRRKRFLAHLLARFGEQLGEHELPGVTLGNDRKKNYLDQFPRLSAGRGCGADVLGWVANQAITDGVSVFEERIRARLGLPSSLRFHVVEHVLLRPIAEDANQLEPGELTSVPLLETAGVSDPWSLRISVAFRDLGDSSFEELVKRTLLAETPAHLLLHLHWFEDSSSWDAFEAAWVAFRALYGEYRRADLTPPTGTPDPIDQLRVRDARDRLIEMLDLGLTYPLRDIPLPERVFVASGMSGNITLGYSQVGVNYFLVDLDENVISSAYEGNDGELVLPTPPIDLDLYCHVRAVKKDSVPERSTTLIGTIWVQEDVDTSVLVDLVDDDGFVEYGAYVTIAVHPAQQMVEYTLFDENPNSPLSLPGNGDEGTTVQIVTLYPVYEDVDLYVHGKTMVGTIHEQVLDQFAPVRVVPNVAQTVDLDAGVVGFGGTTKLIISDSQASVRYRVWGRSIAGDEFVFVGDPPVAPEDLLGLQDGGEALADLLGVMRPTAPPSVNELVPLSDEVDGTGGLLELMFEPLPQDTILYLRASKEHQPGHSSTSSRWFVDPFVVLVRPNHQSTALGLDIEVQNGEAAGPLLMLTGQAGVLYQFRDAQSDVPLGLPLYVYDNLPGIDSIRVQVNLVLQGEGNMPSLDLDSPLPVGTTLEVQAQKAITGIAAEVDGLITIEQSPTFQVPATVLAGEQFVLAVQNSLTDETYQLLQGGGPAGTPEAGDGGTLVLWSGSITQTTVFEVGVQRNGVGVIPLRRRISITVEVTPP